jgi:hypothetical protein
VLDADIQSVDPDYLNGKFNIVNLTIADEKEQFVMDSITMIVTSAADKTSCCLNPNF